MNWLLGGAAGLSALMSGLLIWKLLDVMKRHRSDLLLLALEKENTANALREAAEAKTENKELRNVIDNLEVTYLRTRKARDAAIQALQSTRKRVSQTLDATGVGDFINDAIDRLEQLSEVSSEKTSPASENNRED